MGWQVIGFGEITVDNKDMKKILDLMIGDDKKRVADRLQGNDDDCDFYKVECIDGNISFKMDGNKRIDYGRLDRIKDYCKKNNIGIEINVNEYTEAQDGYYYNSSDEDE